MTSASQCIFESIHLQPLETTNKHHKGRTLNNLNKPFKRLAGLWYLCVLYEALHKAPRLCASQGRRQSQTFYQCSRVVNGRHAILRRLLGNHCVNKVTSIVTPSHVKKYSEGVSVRVVTSPLGVYGSDSDRSWLNLNTARWWSLSGKWRELVKQVCGNGMCLSCGEKKKYTTCNVP